MFVFSPHSCGCCLFDLIIVALYKPFKLLYNTFKQFENGLDYGLSKVYGSSTGLSKDYGLSDGFK